MRRLFCISKIRSLFLFVFHEELPLEEDQVEGADGNAGVGEVEYRAEEDQVLNPGCLAQRAETVASRESRRQFLVCIPTFFLCDWDVT